MRYPGFLPRRPIPVIAAIAGIICVAIGLLFASAGTFDRDAVVRFATGGRRSGVSAVYFSGDMGLRHGLGPVTSRRLSAHGIVVTGINSPTVFGTHRTLAETTAIVTGVVRQALARAGTDRLVLIGQSFGADVLQTGLATLPADLRRHIAAIILVVPGQSVFFRADPTGLLYHSAPDSVGSDTVGRLGWAPLTCIYGVDEADSLCPHVRLRTAHIVAMPGGHSLAHDGAGLTRQVLLAIARAVPGTGLDRELGVAARAAG